MAETLTNRLSRGREGWGSKTAKSWKKKRREGSGERRKAVSVSEDKISENWTKS